MAKKWWNEQQKKQAASGEAVSTGPAPESETPAVNDAFPGVPSREQQEEEGKKVAATAPGLTEAEKTSAVAASGDVKSRVAPSAPGGTITTRDGTFTHEQWAERQRTAREVVE